MTVTSDRLPMLFCEVEVVSAERLSPSFVRVELGGPELADFGVDGPRYDQRIKLVFPDPLTGGLTTVAGADDSWFSTWFDRPVAERGHMRTYTVRDVRGTGAETRIVVDIVLHLDGDAVGSGLALGRAGRPGRPAGDDGAAPRLPLRRHRVHPRPGCRGADGGRRDGRAGRVRGARAAAGLGHRAPSSWRSRRPGTSSTYAAPTASR